MISPLFIVRSDSERQYQLDKLQQARRVLSSVCVLKPTSEALANDELKRKLDLLDRINQKRARA